MNGGFVRGHYSNTMVEFQQVGGTSGLPVICNPGPTGTQTGTTPPGPAGLAVLAPSIATTSQGGLEGG